MARVLKTRVVPHRNGNCEQKAGSNALATAFCLRTIIERKDDKIQGKQA
jgi:hypothetical protein